MRNSNQDRRGSVYVTVLGCATIVTVIGLSALMAARIQRRAAGGTDDAAEARFYAQSATDLALFWMSNDPLWRYHYLNDTWTTDQTIGQGTLNWKLVDELDGDLGNDPNQPVRLYAMGCVGDAVRIHSVLLQSEGASGPSSPNMLTNPDMEDGTVGWSEMRCTITPSTDNPHGGAACLEMTNGESMGAGPQQYVDGIENGVTYHAEVWARKASGTSYVRIAFAITSSGDGKVFFENPADDTLVSTAWTKCTCRLTPTWSGTLSEARLKFTVPSGTYDMFIDDALLVETSGATTPTPVPVPGSWKRVTLP